MYLCICASPTEMYKYASTYTSDISLSPSTWLSRGKAESDPSRHSDFKDTTHQVLHKASEKGTSTRVKHTVHLNESMTEHNFTIRISFGIFAYWLNYHEKRTSAINRFLMILYYTFCAFAITRIDSILS